MMTQLHLEQIVVVMEQALYAKATEIAWKHTSKYANIILRMGTFHTIITLLAIIGKRSQDAGLLDTCIESWIIAEGSASGVMEGRMYNQAVRVHKYIIIWSSTSSRLEMFHSLAGSSPPKPDTISQCISWPSQRCMWRNVPSKVGRIALKWWSGRFVYLMESVPFPPSSRQWKLIYLLDVICWHGWWYITWIDQSLERERAVDSLHLFAIRKMIPWCVAYDRLNYARYLPSY